ncbi:FlgO family outer membrane protein [Plesiomonas shigelloides subsp. oncorhynchi]|nr:FlgO family outer membrane protein [Plesiomonas shigelloides]
MPVINPRQISRMLWTRIRFRCCHATVWTFCRRDGASVGGLNKTLAASGPIAVASFVDLQQMDQTNWLGNLMADSFIYQLQQRGMTVLDYKTTGQIRVTPQGILP